VSSLLDKRYGDKKELNSSKIWRKAKPVMKLSPKQRDNYGRLGLSLTIGSLLPACTIACGGSAVIIEGRLIIDSLIKKDYFGAVIGFAPRIFSNSYFKALSINGTLNPKLAKKLSILPNIGTGYVLGQEYGY